MSEQMTLGPKVKPSALRILAVLRDGKWHSGAEFMDGRHGFRTSTYSQRIGELVRAGYRIERPGPHGDDLGRYRLEEGGRP